MYTYNELHTMDVLHKKINKFQVTIIHNLSIMYQTFESYLL